MREFQPHGRSQDDSYHVTKPILEHTTSLEGLSSLLSILTGDCLPEKPANISRATEACSPTTHRLPSWKGKTRTASNEWDSVSVLIPAKLLQSFFLKPST